MESGEVSQDILIGVLEGLAKHLRLLRTQHAWRGDKRRRTVADRQSHRALYKIVWISRAMGWLLVALAILNLPQIGVITHFGNVLRLVSSFALVLLGIAWLLVLEVFLHFFDRYLSNN